MGQSIIRRPLTADEKIRSQVSPCGMCDGQSDIRSGFAPSNSVNLLTPNVNYSGRTAPLTSKVAFYIFIQQI